MGQINLNNFKVITDKLNTFFVDNKFMVASEIPTTGDFKVGDIIINNGPTNVDEPMWICIEAGNPGIWTVFNSGGGSGGKLTTARNRVVLNGESKSEVSIGISGFNKASDALMVFINSRFMTEGVDYEINADSTKIVAIGEVWNEELASEFEIEMIVFKMMSEEGVVSSVNEIVKLKNTVIVNESVNEVEIGIDGFNEGDDLTVYRNSVYMIEGIDYEVQGNKIVSLKGAWNAEGGSDYKFTFEVIKTVAKVNPDAVVGMEHLTEDVKEAIEAAGNIDLSGYATNDSLDELSREIDYRKQAKTDENLVTNDKSIVGAINELFQDVDSGKGIIADAIDDISISKDSTFAAMGEAIENIHADREEDRQNLINILVGSNMELTGDETLAELILKVNDIDTMAFPEWYNQGIYITGPTIPISYIYGRDMCCAAYKDNKIILAGGFYERGNNYSSDIAMKYCYIFDDTNGTWEQKADMLINSGSLAAAIIDDSFYVINGVYSTKFQCYDIITDTWSYKAEMPSYSSEMNVVAHNNKLYAMGGWSSDPNNGAPQKHNFCYDRLTDTWSYKAEMPYGRRAMGLAIYNDEIYMAGGYYFSNGYKAATTFSKYTIESDSYTELTSMPYETSITTLAFNLGVYIYVHYANYMMAYNILNDSWDNRLSCPTNVTHRTGCVLDDRIHIMCGVNSVAHDVFIETRDTRK